MSLKFRQIDKTLNLLGVARVIGHGRWLGGVHLPASVVSPGHWKQVKTSVYRWVFLNVEHVEQMMYIVIVPAARVVVGIVGDCPHCSNAPQSLNLSERWDACERKKQQIQLCTFPARNLTVLACFSPRAGRRALNTNENCFHIFKNREQSPLKSLSRCLPEPSQGVQPCLPAIIWLV